MRISAMADIVLVVRFCTGRQKAGHIGYYIYPKPEILNPIGECMIPTSMTLNPKSAPVIDSKHTKLVYCKFPGGGAQEFLRSSRVLIMGFPSQPPYTNPT